MVKAWFELRKMGSKQVFQVIFYIFTASNY